MELAPGSVFERSGDAGSHSSSTRIISDGLNGWTNRAGKILYNIMEGGNAMTDATADGMKLRMKPGQNAKNGHEF